MYRKSLSSPSICWNRETCVFNHNNINSLRHDWSQHGPQYCDKITNYNYIMNFVVNFDNMVNNIVTIINHLVNFDICLPYSTILSQCWQFSKYCETILYMALIFSILIILWTILSQYFSPYSRNKTYCCRYCYNVPTILWAI